MAEVMALLPGLIGVNVTGIFVHVTIFGCLYQNLFLIKDLQLKMALSLYFIAFLSAVTINTFAWKALQDGDLVSFGRLNGGNSTMFVIAFIAQSFYSLRRTCMIYNLSPRLQLLIPIGMTCIQIAVSMTNSALWTIDMQKYYGLLETEGTTRSTLATVIHLLITEPLYFALLQYKIVQSATRFTKTESKWKTVGLYVSAIIRLLLYVGTVLLTYMAVGNYIPQLPYYGFVNVFPALIGVIFLTDIQRFQAALGKGPSNVSAKGSSNDALGHGNSSTRHGKSSTLTKDVEHGYREVHVQRPEPHLQRPEPYFRETEYVHA